MNFMMKTDHVSEANDNCVYYASLHLKVNDKKCMVMKNNEYKPINEY